MMDRHEAAERALHNGDAGPRFVTWSHHEPVTLFGAWRSDLGWPAVSAVFTDLATHFSDCRSYRIDLLAAGASGDLAYTVANEHATLSIDGVATEISLRVTHVFRREDGEWKVVHRHADRPPSETTPIDGDPKS